MAAIHKMNEPETKKQLCGILGFFSYFRKYINAFADKAKLLTDLTAKRVPQNIKPLWTREHAKALEALKLDLIHACESQLLIIRLGQPFDAFIDASAYAVGGLIVQRADLGVEHLIAFFSSKLTPAQRNWATIEREAYAVLVTVNKFKHWFFGSKVTIHSDHNPLTYLTESAPKSSKLMRWSLALAESI